MLLKKSRDGHQACSYSSHYPNPHSSIVEARHHSTMLLRFCAGRGGVPWTRLCVRGRSSAGACGPSLHVPPPVFEPPLHSLPQCAVLPYRSVDSEVSSSPIPNVVQLFISIPWGSLVSAAARYCLRRFLGKGDTQAGPHSSVASAASCSAFLRACVSATSVSRSIRYCSLIA